MERKVNKKQCSRCNDMFHPGILWRHERYCGKSKESDRKLNDDWKLDNGMYECPYCKKTFNIHGIVPHIYKKHTEAGQKQDPNIGYRSGTREAWNKGKNTPEEVKLKISKSNTGKKKPQISEETRKRMSDSRILAISEGKVKRWQSISGNSYPERYFEKVLISLDLPFKSQYHIWTGTKNYFLDFYFEDDKVNLEIDGSQHSWEDRIKADAIRDNYMNTIGIRVIRIDWKNPSDKKTQAYFKSKIDELKNMLNK